jgi:hypothetical protein
MYKGVDKGLKLARLSTLSQALQSVEYAKGILDSAYKRDKSPLDTYELLSLKSESEELLNVTRRLEQLIVYEQKKGGLKYVGD